LLRHSVTRLLSPVLIAAAIRRIEPKHEALGGRSVEGDRGGIARQHDQEGEQMREPMRADFIAA